MDWRVDGGSAGGLRCAVADSDAIRRADEDGYTATYGFAVANRCATYADGHLSSNCSAGPNGDSAAADRRSTAAQRQCDSGFVCTGRHLGGGRR